MKYIFKNTILEGPVYRTPEIPAINEQPAVPSKLMQKVSIIGALAKDSGQEIMPLTDTIDVELTSDSISKCQQDIDTAASNFTTQKYSS